MICSNCNKENNNASNFCQYCGNNMNNFNMSNYIENSKYIKKINNLNIISIFFSFIEIIVIFIIMFSVFLSGQGEAIFMIIAIAGIPAALFIKFKLYLIMNYIKNFKNNDLKKVKSITTKELIIAIIFVVISLQNVLINSLVNDVDNSTALILIFVVLLYSINSIIKLNLLKKANNSIKA